MTEKDMYMYKKIFEERQFTVFRPKPKPGKLFDIVYIDVLFGNEDDAMQRYDNWALALKRYKYTQMTTYFKHDTDDKKIIVTRGNIVLSTNPMEIYLDFDYQYYYAHDIIKRYGSLSHHMDAHNERIKNVISYN